MHPNLRRMEIVPSCAFYPGEPAPHRRKYGMGLQFRSRAHEFVNNSWYLACKEADVNMRRPGAFGPAKESLTVRFKRFQKDLPTEGSRWRAADIFGLTRTMWRWREINRENHRLILGGLDPAMVRGRCARWSRRAWQATKHVYMDPPESLADPRRHLIMYPPWDDDMGPTHMFRFVGRAVGDTRPILDSEVGFQFPGHAGVFQSFLAHLHRLPRSWGLMRMKEYDENGVAIPGSETAEGDVPMITIIVPDTKMIPHLMYYIYHQDSEALLMQLCGEYAKPLVNNLFLANQCNEFLDVRIAELRQSYKIAEEVSMDNIGKGLHDLYSLYRLADYFGLSDDRFWNTIHVGHRVLLEAAALKVQWATRKEAQLRRERIQREEAEEKLRKENAAEEKVVEDMVLEDYNEEMEVEEMVLDDEEAVVEITRQEFYRSPRRSRPRRPRRPRG